MSFSNFLGVFFGEVLSPDDDYPERSPKFRFPLSYEEALKSNIVHFISPDETSPTGCKGHSVPFADLTIPQLARHISDAVRTMSRPGDLIYSPNANSVLGVLLNVGQMLDPSMAPSWKVQMFDLSDELQYPAVQSLNMRRSFSLDLMARLTGWSNINNTLRDTPAWKTEQFNLMAAVVRALFHRKAPICHRA